MHSRESFYDNGSMRRADSFLSVANGGSILPVEEVLRQRAHKIFIRGLRRFNGTRRRIREARMGIKYPGKPVESRRILPYECKVPFYPRSVRDLLSRQRFHNHRFFRVARIAEAFENTRTNVRIILISNSISVC